MSLHILSGGEIQQRKGAKAAEIVTAMPSFFHTAIVFLNCATSPVTGVRKLAEQHREKGKKEALPEQDGCLGLLGFCVGRLDTEPVFISFNLGCTHHPDML